MWQLDRRVWLGGFAALVGSPEWTLPTEQQPLRFSWSTATLGPLVRAVQPLGARGLAARSAIYAQLGAGLGLGATRLTDQDGTRTDQQFTGWATRMGAGLRVDGSRLGFSLGFALGAPDPAIASHVASCPACRRCLDQIRGDVVVLPALAVTARPVRRARRRWWLAPALAAAAAAAALVIALRPPGSRPAGTEDRVAIKGIGEVTLELVRERAGQIRFDARHYAPGDRWKVVVSCPPSASGSPMPMWIDVSVADGVTVDHPLAASRIACGNRVVVPGAFAITGDRVNRVCARIAVTPGADAGTACVTLAPEPRGPQPH